MNYIKVFFNTPIRPGIVGDQKESVFPSDRMAALPYYPGYKPYNWCHGLITGVMRYLEQPLLSPKRGNQNSNKLQT